MDYQANLGSMGGVAIEFHMSDLPVDLPKIVSEDAHLCYGEGRTA